MRLKIDRRILGIIVVMAAGLVSFLQGYWSLTRWRSFSPDSRNYVNVAENLLKGRGFVQDTVGLGEVRLVVPLTIPQPFGVHGPVFPLSIAVLSRLGLDATDAALLIPALAHAGLLLTVFLLMRRLYETRVGLWALLLLLLSDPLRQITTAAWAEPLALLWLLLSLLALARGALQPPGNVFWLAVAGILAGLAFATRYPLAIGLPIGLLIVTRIKDWHGSVKRAVAYSIGFAIVAAPTLWRNLIATGHLMGNERNPSDISFFENLRQCASVLFERYAIRSGWSEDARLQAAALAAIVVLLAVRLARTNVFARLGELFLAPGRIALVLWFFGYAAFLVFQRTLFSFDSLNVRLLSPAHLFLMCLVSVALDAALRLSPQWIAGIILAACLGRGAILAKAIHETTPVARRPNAAASERRRWIKRHTTPDDLIIGQRCTDLPFYLGRPCLHFSQAPEMRHVTRDDIHRALVEACPRYRAIYLVLQKDCRSHDDWRERYGDYITDLYFGRHESDPNVTEVARLEDGVVFELSCRRIFSPARRRRDDKGKT